MIHNTLRIEIPRLVLSEEKSLHQLAFSDDINWDKYSSNIALKLIEFFMESHEKQTPLHPLSPQSIFIKNEGALTLYIPSKTPRVDPEYCLLESPRDTPQDPYRDDLFILGLLLYFVFTKQSLLRDILRIRCTDLSQQKCIKIYLERCSLRHSTIKMLEGLLQIDPANRISLLDAQALFLAPPTPIYKPASFLDSPRSSPNSLNSPHPFVGSPKLPIQKSAPFLDSPRSSASAAFNSLRLLFGSPRNSLQKSASFVDSPPSFDILDDSARSTATAVDSSFTKMF